MVENLAAGEACKALFCPTPGLKDRTYYSTGLPAMGTLISASAVLHGAKRRGRIRGEMVSNALGKA